MEALVKNAADEEQVKSAGKRVSRVEQEDMLDLQHLLNIPQGRRFLRALLRRCRVNALSFSASDTHMTSFNEGERNIGLWLVARMTVADLRAFVTMQVEEQGEK